MPFPEGAAKKGGHASKPGKHKKTKQWEALAEKFTGPYADRVIEYLDDLWNEDRDKFYQAYKDLLKYFQPQLQAAKVDMDLSLPDIKVDISKEQIKEFLKKL